MYDVTETYINIFIYICKKDMLPPSWSTIYFKHVRIKIIMHRPWWVFIYWRATTYWYHWFIFFRKTWLWCFIYIYIYIHIYIYIYIVHMWQKSSVFFHESAQRNVAGHLIDKMSLKQHGHFATNGFVFPFIRQMLQNTQKSILNLWIVVNRKNANAFWIANQ